MPDNQAPWGPPQGPQRPGPQQGRPQGPPPPRYGPQGGQPYRPQPPYQPQAPYGQQPLPQAAPGGRRPPRRPWIKRHKILSSLIAVVAVFILIGAIGAAIGPRPKQAAATAATLPTASAAPSAKASPTAAAARKTVVARVPATRKTKAAAHRPDAEDACLARPHASGDVYVVSVESGLQTSAEEIGGGWSWDYITKTCLTSVQDTLATAPTGAGYCTQVGYVADNPGYDVNATPAKRLKVLAGEVGAAC